jgi:hypothetical protein
MTYRNPSDDRAGEAERDRREAEALLSGMSNRRRSTLVLVAFFVVLGTALAIGGIFVYRSMKTPPLPPPPPLNPLIALCTGSGGNLKMEPCCGEDYPGTCAPGPFGCAPNARHACVICDCPASQCFDVDAGCIKSPY